MNKHLVNILIVILGLPFALIVFIGLCLFSLSKLIRAFSYVFLFDFECAKNELITWDIETSLKEKVW